MRLQACIRSGHSRVTCAFEQECWATSKDRLHVFKLMSNEDGKFRAEKLGVCAVGNQDEVLRCFTCGHFTVLIVTTSTAQTAIFRVGFNPGQTRKAKEQDLLQPLKHFGRRCTACDFNAQERLMAFVTESKVLNVYRFNANFSSLEITRTANLSLQTSLSTVKHVTATDNSVFLVDDSDTIQSINFRSMQTSRELRPTQLGSAVWRSTCSTYQMGRSSRDLPCHRRLPMSQTWSIPALLKRLPAKIIAIYRSTSLRLFCLRARWQSSALATRSSS